MRSKLVFLVVVLLAACGSSSAGRHEVSQDVMVQDQAPDLGEQVQPDNGKVTVLQNDDASVYQRRSNIRKFCDEGNLLYEFKQGDNTAVVVSQSDPQCSRTSVAGGIQVYP